MPSLFLHFAPFILTNIALIILYTPKNSKRKNAVSATLSGSARGSVCTTISPDEPKRRPYMTPSYTFNTTLKSRGKIVVKR